jgi:hypothetical protein
MAYFSQLVRPMFVAWLVFLLAGVPLPVTHCHAFEMETPQAGRVLQLHLCDCAHDLIEARNDEVNDESWHIHWVCFHFTDEPAGTLSSAHLDAVGSVSAVSMEPRVDILRCNSIDESFLVWNSRADNVELGIRNIEASYRSMSLARQSKLLTHYCANSSRLLL